MLLLYVIDTRWAAHSPFGSQTPSWIGMQWNLVASPGSKLNRLLHEGSMWTGAVSAICFNLASQIWCSQENCTCLLRVNNFMADRDPDGFLPGPGEQIQGYSLSDCFHHSSSIFWLGLGSFFHNLYWSFFHSSIIIGLPRLIIQRHQTKIWS